jgi:hypothetical protein
VVDKGRRELPLVVRFNAWHSQLYRTVHDRLCRAIRLLLRVANADEAIMPVRRYMSSREALAAVIRRHAGCAVVRAVMRLRVEARAAWKVALEHEVAQVVVGYVQHCQAAGAGHGLPRSTARVQAHALAAVHDLVIGAYERLGCGCSLCCCRRGCRATPGRPAGVSSTGPAGVAGRATGTGSPLSMQGISLLHCDRGRGIALPRPRRWSGTCQ